MRQTRQCGTYNARVNAGEGGGAGPTHLAGKVALVTGASRGIGAATARMLAERGADVVVNCRSKTHRADAVAAAVRTAGRRALPVQADLTDIRETAAMFAAVGEQFGRLDLLVLNASGGLERDRPPDYPMQVNRTAQVRAVDLALPLMPPGSRIVFVTSHMAHFYGSKPVYAVYEPVAASKRAGEDALRARLPELTGRGVSLVVVSGDLIEGTITPRLMDRRDAGLIEARRQAAGGLPTVEEFAAAIVTAATGAGLGSGATVYVGSTEWESAGARNPSPAE
jgi:NAD(P)-dependent dehydrogenase (short-subunit alcohol dehydrogenase family)